MAAITKRTAALAPARMARKVPAVVCKASIQSQVASMALAGLIALAPNMPAYAGVSESSKDMEAEMLALIAARKGDKFIAAEENLKAPEVNAEPIQLAPEPAVTLSLSAEKRTEAIRAEAIKDAQEAAAIRLETTTEQTPKAAAVLGASTAEIKKAVAPAAVKASSMAAPAEGTSSSGNSSALFLAVVAVIGIAGAAFLAKPAEETPAAPAAPPAPAATETKPEAPLASSE